MAYVACLEMYLGVREQTLRVTIVGMLRETQGGDLKVKESRNLELEVLKYVYDI